ncbi:hypothetical protein N480_00320 [Pseudoalteromonas luteoviolacea S2607]|uniref:hypothetical protein n=1 Tax=Pseudoalteromonas luteoviolacea TaxID=43657 RepID=UPI0007B070E6|nr:hypothetical protein [Pseudoalteromonas luteoviolacea]KZN39305.1 hypothetical protein N480_00320 [Pseudoalteromonas luteoviolacea S2607]
MKSVRDIVGLLSGDHSSGLVQRCKESWEIPIPELTDLMVATYINQNIARSEMIEEAEKRIEAGQDDDTLMYDEQLMEAVNRATNT